MSNLKISYPVIPYQALNIITSNDYATEHHELNLIGGVRHGLCKLDSAASGNVTIDFDLGASNTATVDHLIIGRADILKNEGVTQIDLESASTYPTFGSVYTDASFSSATLKGIRSHDYLATFSESGAARYWRWQTYNASSTSRMHSTVHFGVLFDFNVDCDYTLDINPGLTPLETTIDGTDHNNHINTPVYEFEMTWIGVTDAKVKTFLSTVVPRRYVYLYASDSKFVLDENDIVHCEIIGVPTVQDEAHDKNRVRCRFREVLG